MQYGGGGYDGGCYGGCGKLTGFPYCEEGAPLWTGSPSSPGSGRDGAVPFSPARSIRSSSSVAVGGSLSFPPGWLPFSTDSRSVVAPLSSEQGGGAWGSPVPGCGGSRLSSEARRPEPASAPPGLAAHKCALREEVCAKAAAGGVFPFASRAELGLRGEMTASCCRFKEVLEGLNTAISEMQRCAQDMRKLSSEYQIRDFGPIHVHYRVLSNACFKYDQIAEKLEDVAEKLLVEAVAEASPPHEVQEEYLSLNLDDPGWK